MNKYIIPVCNINESDNWLLKISAQSLDECKDKIIAQLTDLYDLEDYGSYWKFVSEVDNNHDIIIGDIVDIETL